MTSPILSVQKLSKSYRNYTSQMRRVLGWFGLSHGGFTENWVLKDISFDVGPGQALGIAGRNGAGKSTLLKIITGTLAPSTGSVFAGGKISAILELGMGFNAELTGRQNAMHACGLMGHDRAAILQAMPDIETFAEIGPYFDKPVRTYSSGMQVRLAFAVATAFRPEILIIDEALSVGDAYFQHKSFNRIREYQKKGTTLIFVSHDRTAILTLCDRVVLLDQGTVIQDGKPEPVMDYYNALIAEKENSRAISQTETGSKRVDTVSGTGEAAFVSISLVNSSGAPVELVDVGEEVTLKLELLAHADLDEVVIGYMIKDRFGRAIFGTNTHFTGHVQEDLKKGQRLSADFTFRAAMGPGDYAITLAAHRGRTHVEYNYEWRDLGLTFTVVNHSKNEFVGCSWLEPSVSCGVKHHAA